MATRPRLNRYVSLGSNPNKDFDDCDLFESPQQQQQRSYFESRASRDYRNPRRTRIPRRPETPEPEVELRRDSPEQPIVFIPDTSKIVKSLNYLKIELDYLKDVGIVSDRGMENILEELPKNIPMIHTHRKKRRRRRSRRDSRRLPARYGFEAVEVEPKKELDALDWAVKVAKKFGNSAMFGFGATFAGEIMKHGMKPFNL